jgi:hypothetical protein
MSGTGGLWRWLFFLGLVIGLLSKGPLAAMLIGIPIVLWLLLFRQEAVKLRKLPWWRGTLLTLLLAGPWYVLAELKTPGFMNYFIVGEHIRRFLDPGWTGDLYGSAHDEPKGMIWVFWVWASFPWGIVALGGLVAGWFRGRGTDCTRHTLADPVSCFIIASALAPMLFFTAAGNILWTYVLPSLPFTALLIGRWVAELESGGLTRMSSLMVGFVPVLLAAMVALVPTGCVPINSEKELVNFYDSTAEPGDSPLLYLDDLPFSARFYSHGTAMEVTENDLIDVRENEGVQRVYVAVPKSWSDQKIIGLSSSVHKVLENRRYQLLIIEAPDQNQQPVANSSEVQLNDI